MTTKPTDSRRRMNHLTCIYASTGSSRGPERQVDRMEAKEGGMKIRQPKEHNSKNMKTTTLRAAALIGAAALATAVQAQTEKFHRSA
jgi:hypothetical protein